ncbi:MlaD family protein [Aestuariimicrobium ganziense]|uniref:hypothetical protein n=1 Tax=Aestuariimicrobium ganziense TaxID=2773677 RepID=UPI00194430D5|nr:hypothetical protein [Aestuariimicrobium ganziense]
MSQVIEINKFSRGAPNYLPLVARCDLLLRELDESSWREWAEGYQFSINVELKAGPAVAGEVTDVINPSGGAFTHAVVYMSMAVPRDTSAEILTSGLVALVHQVLGRIAGDIGLAVPQRLRQTRRERSVAPAAEPLLSWREGLPTFVRTAQRATEADFWDLLARPDVLERVRAMS